MRAIQVKCPNCAASLKADPEATSIECEYCHTKSAVQRRSRIMQIPVPLAADPGQQVAREKVRRAVLAVVIASFVLPIFTGAIIGISVCNKVTTSFDSHAVTTRATRDIQTQIQQQMSEAFGKTGVKIQIGPGGAASVERAPTWQGTGAVLLSDVDGDKVEDVIGRARYHAPDTIRIAAWSGATGRQLWESPTLGSYNETYQGYLLLIGDLLVFADPTATLTGYATRDGARRWATQLPDKTDTACLNAGGALHIKTVDDNWHAISVADGARTPSEGPGRCLPVHNDRRPGAATILRGRPSRVPKIDGMQVSDVAQLDEDGPRVAIGYKERGTAIGMLARLDEPRWVAEVPAQDALQSDHDEDMLAMTSDRVCTVYELPHRNAPRLTCFDMGTGSRTWDTEIAKGVTIVMESLVASRDRLFLSSWGHVQVFDLATGRQLHLIGEL